MKTQLSTLALLAGIAAASAAFAQPVGGPAAKGNAPLKAPHEVNNGSASHGANSFTEGQARTHIERAGFSNVSGLTQDGGVWRGTAMRNGAQVAVAMDYKGNVTTGAAMGGGAHHARSATTTTTHTMNRPVVAQDPGPAPQAMNDQAAPADTATTTTTTTAGAGMAGAGMAMHHHMHHHYRHMHHHYRHMRRHYRHHRHAMMQGGVPGERMDGQGAAMSGVDRNQNGVSDKEDRATGR